MNNPLYMRQWLSGLKRVIKVAFIYKITNDVNGKVYIGKQIILLKNVSKNTVGMQGVDVVKSDHYILLCVSMELSISRLNNWKKCL